MELYEIIKLHNRPWSPLEILCFSVIFLFLAGRAYVLWQRKRIRGSQAAAVCFMVLYLGIVFASTVFTRNSTEEATCQLQLFWSWEKVIQEQSREALKENILNMMLLLPFGMLLPVIGNRKLKVRYGLAAGFLVSLIIELCQLIFHRGLFEWDDMIHNAIGSMAGCMIMNRVLSWIARCGRKRKESRD